LKSYRQVLAQFHLHPESKFLNGDFCDTGLTRRRHVHSTNIKNIGKEADHWEEQFYLGLDPDEAVEYGLTPSGQADLVRAARALADQAGQRSLARDLGISRGTLSKLLRGVPIGRCQALFRRLRDVAGSAERGYRDRSSSV